MFLEVWKNFFSKILEIFWIFSREISWNETGQLYPDIMFGASVHGHPIQKRLKNFPKFFLKICRFFSIFGPIFLWKSLLSDLSPQAWDQIQVLFPPFSVGDSTTLTPSDLNRAISFPFRKIPKYQLLKGFKIFSTLNDPWSPLPKLLCTQNWSYFNLLLT